MAEKTGGAKKPDPTGPLRNACKTVASATAIMPRLTALIVTA
ncbi:MAG: hypothetical protein AAGD34_03700 [Pseudomonadota bacterium]